MAEKKLASAGDDIKIWDTSAYKLVKQYNPHSHFVSSLAWSNDNQYLASASNAGDKVALTFTKSSVVEPIEVGNGEDKTCLAFNSNSRFLLSGGKDCVVAIWDMKTHAHRKVYKDHKSPVTCVTYNYNDSYVASGAENGDILLNNVTTGQGCAPLRAPKVQAIRQIQYNNYKKSMLGAVSDDGALNLWDTNQRRLLLSFTDSHRAPATGIAFSPINEMFLMSVGLDKRFVCYDLQQKSAVRTVTLESPLTAIDIMCDGATLAVGSTRGKVYIYDLRQAMEPVRTFTAHKSSIHCLKFQSNCQTKADGAGSARTGTSRKTSSSKAASSSRSSEAQLNHAPSAASATEKDNAAAKGALAEKQNGTAKKGGYSLDVQENGEVISPFREGAGLVTPKIELPQDRAGENRPNIIGKAAPGGPSRNSDLYTDEVFSPVGDNTSTSSDQHARRHPIGGGSHGPSPLLGIRPTTTGFASNDLDLPAGLRLTDKMLGNVDTLSVSQPQTVPSIGSTPHRNRDQSGASPRLIDRNSGSRDGTSTVLSSTSASKVNGDNYNTRYGTPRGEQRMPQDRGTPTPAPSSLPTDTSAALSGVESGGAAGMLSPDTALSPQESAVGSMQPFHTEFIRNMIDDSLSDFREQVHRDIVNVQVEMLRQFQIQQNEMQALLQHYSVNEGLVAEVERLREENKMLKKKF